MKAFVLHEPNGAFEPKTIPVPDINAGDVLVKIHGACINPLDTKIRAGVAAHARQSLPAVLGLDMAGKVEAVGADVSKFAVGDEVYGLVGGVGGHQGTLAEYVVVPTSLLAKKPKSLSMSEAAALPLVSITAWEGLMDRARVRAGETVLIHAGAGGVGYIAVQLAIAAGAQVFATVSAEKRDVVVALGATPIDYRAQVPEQYVNEHTGGAGFDIVYDTVGGSTLDASFVSVKRYTGRAVSCLGWGTHSLAPLSFRGATYSGVFTLMPLLTGQGQRHHGEILNEIAKLADTGKVMPLLAERPFKPRDVEKAFAAVVAGVTGKVVVNMLEWDS
jgi:NADPH:quinone reductase-like Zn-dependent oxidoreductase